MDGDGKSDGQSGLCSFISLQTAEGGVPSSVDAVRVGPQWSPAGLTSVVGSNVNFYCKKLCGKGFSIVTKILYFNPSFFLRIKVISLVDLNLS